MFAERQSALPRLRFTQSTEHLPKGAEIGLVDDELWVFCPDGSVWLYEEPDDGTGKGVLIYIQAH